MRVQVSPPCGCPPPARAQDGCGKPTHRTPRPAPRPASGAEAVACLDRMGPDEGRTINGIRFMFRGPASASAVVLALLAGR